MRKRIAQIIGVALIGLSAAASDLRLSIDHYGALVWNAGKPSVLRVRFSEDRVRANLSLDVYEIGGRPSTSVNLAELQRLTDKTWHQKVEWIVRDTRGIPYEVHPIYVRGTVRQRGPGAANASDRDTSVACVTYDGVFDLGTLSPGDYVVVAQLGGLVSKGFPIAIRTGNEPQVRDVYLQEKARRASDWKSFKAIQLERIRLDPTKSPAVLDLAHRSLEFGTLEETSDYFERAATTIERNIAAWTQLNPADAELQRPQAIRMVKDIRSLQRVLPDYFAHRKEWSVMRDPGTGRYVIHERGTRKIVRVIE